MDRPIERWASHKLGRTVRFQALETRLLSANHSISVRGLSISSPSWAPRTSLAQIDRLSARIELLPLLRGDVRIPYLFIQRPHLHLMRTHDGRNNWTFPGTTPNQPPFAALAGTQTFQMSEGELSFDDQTAGLVFAGSFAQRSDTGLPFILRGRGVLRGGQIELSARGGPLNGTSVGQPYPFVAHLTDGGLSLDAKGTSGQPFDLQRYDLAIEARGPNLADFAYLFNLQTPNSAPFVLSTHAQASGPFVKFSGIKGKTGESDFTGWIRSDQSTPRHKVASALWSSRWTKSDVEAWLSSLPARTVARSTSGRLALGPASRWLLSDEAFPVAQLRAVDFVSAIHISSLEGYALPLRSVRALVALDHGKLTVSGLYAKLYGGAVSGAVRLDVQRPVPELALHGIVREVDLSKIRAPLARSLAGMLDSRIVMHGAGRSVHAAAATASGAASVKITGGRLPQPAAFLLGGDLLRGIATLGKKDGAVMLDCARVSAGGSGGQMAFRDFVLRTPEGMTEGKGTLNLGTEGIILKLTGQPVRRRLFQVSMPVVIQGSLSHPTVTVLPARNATELGLRGKLGVALSRLPHCYPWVPLPKSPLVVDNLAE